MQPYHEDDPSYRPYYNKKHHNDPHKSVWVKLNFSCSFCSKSLENKKIHMKTIIIIEY